MDEQIEVEAEGDRVQRRGSGGVIRALFVLPGIGFIAFGVALFFWPELLIYLVGVVFIMIGVGLLVAARKVGQVKRKADDLRARFSAWREP